MAKLKLTEARRQIIDAAIHEWLEVGRSTAPADFATAEKAIWRLYLQAGHSRPKFVRLASPHAAKMYIADQMSINVDASTDDARWRGPLTDQLKTDLVGGLKFEIRGQLSRQARSELAERFSGELRAQFSNRLEGNLRLQLMALRSIAPRLSAADEIEPRIWRRRGERLQILAHAADQGSGLTGGRDHLLMRLDGARRIGAVYPPSMNAALDAHMRICRGIGWWYPFLHRCVVTDRPEIVALDEEGNLHSETGPALRYRDGWSMWSLHGVAVTRKLVEAPETLTFAEVRDMPNAEMRRLMLDRFGGKRGAQALAAWIGAGGLKPMSREDITHKMQPAGLSCWRLAHGAAPVTCDLYRAELDGDEPLHILTVVCTSTAKIVPLRVPPEIMDAAKARAWTFGMDLAAAFET